MVDAVCGEIADSPLKEQIIVKSFRLEVIPRTRAVLPSVRTAALFAPKIMRLLRKEKYLIDIARELGADHLSLHKSLVSRKLDDTGDTSGNTTACATSCASIHSSRPAAVSSRVWFHVCPRCVWTSTYLPGGNAAFTSC